MRLIDIYEQLLEILGHQNWWPADTPFEVIVGALLTQQTRWNNVEQAISSLKERGLLEPETLAAADTGSLEELIRCTGFYRQKARRLKNLAGYYSRHRDILSEKPVDELRRELLGLEGVGDETADSIILYAVNKPKFVIDAYTFRMLDCLGLNGNYRMLQQRFESELEHDVDLFKEYHALIVEYGKQYCTRHRCEECVLVENGKTII